MSDGSYESVVWVQPWNDRRAEDSGVAVAHPYAEKYWTSVLGPTQLLLLRHVAEELEANPDGFSMPMADVAIQLGVSPNKGGLGIQRAFGRLEMYRMASRGHSLWAVRRSVPVLGPVQVRRLPERLQRSHQRDAAEARAVWDETAAGAAAQVALDMANAGAEASTIRRSLRSLRVPPWACDETARQAIQEVARNGRQGPSANGTGQDGSHLLSAARL